MTVTISGTAISFSNGNTSIGGYDSTTGGTPATSYPLGQYIYAEYGAGTLNYGLNAQNTIYRNYGNLSCVPGPYYFYTWGTTGVASPVVCSGTWTSRGMGLFQRTA